MATIKTPLYPGGKYHVIFESHDRDNGLLEMIASYVDIHTSNKLITFRVKNGSASLPLEKIVAITAVDEVAELTQASLVSDSFD